MLEVEAGDLLAFVSGGAAPCSVLSLLSREILTADVSMALTLSAAQLPMRARSIVETVKMYNIVVRSAFSVRLTICSSHLRSYSATVISFILVTFAFADSGIEHTKSVGIHGALALCNLNLLLASVSPCSRVQR